MLAHAAMDALIVYWCYVAVCRLVLDVGIEGQKGVYAMGMIWLTCSYLLGRYREKERIGTLGSVVSRGVSVAVITGALIVGQTWVMGIVNASTRFRDFLVPVLSIITILSLVQEIIIRKRTSQVKKWWILCSNKERELIVREIEDEIMRKESEGHRAVIGFSRAEEAVDSEIETTEGYVVSANNKIGEDKMIEYVIRAKERGFRTISLIEWCELNLQRVPPELVSLDWLTSEVGFRLRTGTLRWRLKRVFDIIVSSGLLVVASPVVLVAALLVVIEDRGPVLYSQIRSGMNGELIRIWKIRTMRQDSESTGPQWAKVNDSRITRVGKFLRATRIDELPQLIGVLKGELSLIGPRPERPEMEEVLEKQITRYRLRHIVRPGLSGWAQVCYGYGASIHDSRMKLSYDLYYVRNGGVGLDILIMLKTIVMVLGGHGATPVNSVRKKV